MVKNKYVISDLLNLGRGHIKPLYDSSIGVNKTKLENSLKHITDAILDIIDANYDISEKTKIEINNYCLNYMLYSNNENEHEEYSNLEKFLDLLSATILVDVVDKIGNHLPRID